MSNLQLRVISAVVLAVVTLGLTWLGGLPFRLLCAAMTILIFYAPVDALRLEQVLVNLIDNALKYSPPGAPVTVSVAVAGPDAAGPAEERAPADRQGRRVVLTVTDAGPGVPLEDRPHLFDQFFRSPATSDTAGLGLGLHISRQIVEHHDGTVRLEFPPEGGTRAVVTLDV